MTTARPILGSRGAGFRSSAVLAALAWTVLAILFLVPTARASETTVGFDDLMVGTPVSDQYEAQGLKLGHATEFAQTALSVGDCGSPTVREGGSPSDAFSPPRYALLAKCQPDAAAPFSSGTFGALLGQGRGSLSVEVRNFTVGGLAPKAKLTGYNGAGQSVVSEEATLEAGKWTHIAIAPAGGAKTISYFSIVTAESNSDEIAIDGLGFESEPPTKTETPPPPPTTTTTTTTTPPPTLPPPPIAATPSLLTPNPASGQEMAVSGAASQPGNGRIISYDWDLNGDGKIDTSTGTNPVADVILAPGVHTIGLTVTNSNRESSSSRFTMTIPTKIQSLPPKDGGEGECVSTFEDGDAHIIAECIQKLGSGYVISSKQLALNGMVLTPSEGGYGVFKIQTVKHLGISTEVQLSGTPVNVELLNTPIGNVVLGGRNLESEPMTLVFEAFHAQTLKAVLGSARPRAHAAGGDAKTLVMAFAVAHKCAGGSKKAGCCPPQNNTSCAELPGSFPLTGQVAVYLNDKGQSLFDVQVGLELKSVNFEATGALEILADREAGIDLESLKFAIPEAGLAEIFKVKNASFTYYFPSDPEESKRDSWQAKGTITFGPLEEPGMEAELAFKKGEFHSALMVFTAPPGAGAMIYPGVEVNKIGASIGVNPLAFGGVLGAAIATQLELTLEFKFREATSTELGFFGGQGKLAYKGDEIATLAADLYSDGYMDAKLAIDLHFPFDSKEPAVEVGGGISFWDESASGLWQAEGNAHIKIWVISAEAAVLVNNNYAAGCAAAGEFGVQGRYRFSDGNIDGGFFGLKKCSDELKQYKQKPLVKHSGGFVKEEESLRTLPSVGAPWLVALSRAHAATLESQSFSLPGSTPGQELRIGSGSGIPIVHLKGPGGQIFTTPATPGQIVTSGNEFISAIGPDAHETIVFLRNPKGGQWLLQPAPGSAPITKLEVAQDVPPATIEAHVKHKRANRWSLAYKVANFVPGMHVRFVERGRDTTHMLGTVGAARGTLTFSSEEGLSRSRTIDAYLLNAEGMPRRELTVTHYLAPAAGRGGSVRGVRFVRHGSTALVSWPAVAGTRAYRIKIRGTDGRVQTLWRKPSRRSVQIVGVLPFDSYTATVVAEGGHYLLAGRSATGRLTAVKVKPQHPAKRRAAKKA